jgi:2-methylcitrate dehydratase
LTPAADDEVEKFDRLVARCIDDGLCREIKAAVSSLENIQVRDLMELLARISPAEPVLATASGQN